MAQIKPKVKAGQFEKAQRRARGTQLCRAGAVDDLAEFEQFREEVLKSIRKDLYSGLTSKAIREKYAAVVQAKLITKAIKDDDPAAISAAKDILDRAEGKAKETIDQTHKFESLPHDELDAMIITKLKQREDDENGLSESIAEH